MNVKLNQLPCGFRSFVYIFSTYVYQLPIAAGKLIASRIFLQKMSDYLPRERERERERATKIFKIFSQKRAKNNLRKLHQLGNTRGAFFKHPGHKLGAS